MLIRRIKEHEEQKKSNALELDNLLREDFPESLKAILKEYSGVFPKDLPPRLPLLQQEHEFKVGLKDDEHLTIG